MFLRMSVECRRSGFWISGAQQFTGRACYCQSKPEPELASFRSWFLLGVCRRTPRRRHCRPWPQRQRWRLERKCCAVTSHVVEHVFECLCCVGGGRARRGRLLLSGNTVAHILCAIICIFLSCFFRISCHFHFVRSEVCLGQLLLCGAMLSLCLWDLRCFRVKIPYIVMEKYLHNPYVFSTKRFMLKLMLFELIPECLSMWPCRSGFTCNALSP